MRNIDNYFVLLLLTFCLSCSRSISPYEASKNPPAVLPGYQLVWSEEFAKGGRPDSGAWSHEQGFQRNQELQYYQLENANVKGGAHHTGQCGLGP